MIKLARPPKDLSSFIGRKWLESLLAQNQALNEGLDLPFILLLADPLLPNSRTIAVAAALTLTDGGAGSSLTLNLSDTGVTPGTYNSLTVDAKGRVTSGTVIVSTATVSNSDGTLVISPTSGNVIASLNLARANTWLADQSVPDEAYGVAWNGSFEVPTKNALYDKIETISGGGGNLVTTTLAFGVSFTDKSQTVFTGEAWVTANSEIIAQVLTPTGVDPDEMRLLDFKPVISDLVAGDGFTVTLYSEPEAKGDYSVMCIGVSYCWRKDSIIGYAR